MSGRLYDGAPRYGVQKDGSTRYAFISPSDEPTMITLTRRDGFWMWVRIRNVVLDLRDLPVVMG